MLMILAALQMMPEEHVDAARVDGASPMQMLWFVTLPYLKGVLLVAGLFRLIDSIKAFPLIYILTDGGPGTLTEVTNYYGFVQAFNFSFLGYSRLRLRRTASHTQRRMADDGQRAIPALRPDRLGSKAWRHAMPASGCGPANGA